MLFTNCSCLGNVLSIFGTLFVLFYFLMKYKHTYWKRRGFPTLPSHWLFGHAKNSILMRASPGQNLGELYQEAKDDDPVLGIYILHQPFLLLRSPEVIKQILIKDFNLFSNRYFSAKSIRDKVGNSNLFTMDNPEWKYVRTKLTPVFTSGKIKRLFHLMVESADSMKEHLQERFADGAKMKTIHLRDLITKYTTNIISTVAFGISTNSFLARDSEFYEESRKIVQPSFFKAIRFFCMFFFPRIGEFLSGEMLGESSNYFRRVFWSSMDARESSKTKRGDLIDNLVELKNAKQESTTFKFEGDSLLSQSAIFFIAGRESSVTTMMFALYELAKQPALQTRVREEILEKLESQGLTYESVQDMKYLYQVISEALRMYPAAPLLDRVALEDYKIPGTNMVIEKGTPIYVPLCGLHYDPRYFPDPMRFDPDRFSEERKNEIVQGTYMPFGEGPRICIGLRLGMLQSAMGLITVLKDYEVILDPSCDYTIDVRNIFTSASEGFRLHFKKIA